MVSSDTSASAGSTEPRPVPDLATSLPTPTDGGRTYTFQLRRGIRYSNGDPVRASDLRRALERVFRIWIARASSSTAGSPAPTPARRRHCDLSRGIDTDDRAGTVILHLREPDPEITYKLALPFANPVPRDVPMARQARLGVPGTGPYMLQSYNEGLIARAGTKPALQGMVRRRAARRVSGSDRGDI